MPVILPAAGAILRGATGLASGAATLRRSAGEGLLSKAADLASAGVVGYGLGAMAGGDDTGAPAEQAAPTPDAPALDVQSLPNGNKRVTVDMDNPHAVGIKNTLESFGQGVAVQGQNGKRLMVFTLTDREFQRLNTAGL